uniref:Ubiquinol-cytochrome C reductase hinge domain-containing protein n=1 Tax=Trichuris muris TaxID=70415 RepID=A0A5S6R488_TRIMR
MIAVIFFLTFAFFTSCRAINVDAAMKACETMVCKKMIAEYKRECHTLLGESKDTEECKNKYDKYYVDCIIPCVKQIKKLD